MSPHFENLIERYPALEECRPDIQKAFDLLAAAFRKDGKLLLCGNGGSAADSEHWAGEMLKGFCPFQAALTLDAGRIAVGTSLPTAMGVSSHSANGVLCVCDGFQQ
jgi:phosphoheptose isomerase